MRQSLEWIVNQWVNSISGVGASRRDAELLTLAERAATDAKAIVELLPGHPPWGSQADAALAHAFLAHGDVPRAAEAARAAYAGLEAALHEDTHLDVVLPVAEALIANGDEAEASALRDFLQVTLAMVAQRTFDEDVRARWLRGPLGSRLAKLAGDLGGLLTRPRAAPGGTGLEDTDVELLRRLVEGLTNREIAERLGLETDFVTRRLGEIFAMLGTNTRAEAAAFALRSQVV